MELKPCPFCGYREFREHDSLIEELAEVLEEIVNEAKGYESRHGKLVSWRERGEQVIRKYHEQVGE